MNIFLDFHFFLFPIHALGSKKHLYSFQKKKIIENSSQQNGCNSGMCFPIHGTISDGINIADYPTSYNEYNEVKFFLKVSSVFVYHISISLQFKKFEFPAQRVVLTKVLTKFRFS